MISALVNTWNEEANLKNCLSCLKWCDEIVVVDMHSQDKTREIAKEFTDKIFLHQPTFYVEPARQFGVEKTKGEWVLILDADEMITPQLAKILQESTQDKNLDILSLPRKNYMFGKWIKTAGWWPGYQLRFFRKGKLSFSDRIHSFPQTLGAIRRLPAQEQYAIIHFNYLDATQFVDRLNRYTTIEALNLISSGRNTNLLKMSKALAKEFLLRFVRYQSFRGGWEGFFLTGAMVFYRLSTHFKCRELLLKEKDQIDPQRIYASEAEKVLRKWQQK